MDILKHGKGSNIPLRMPNKRDWTQESVRPNKRDWTQEGTDYQSCEDSGGFVKKAKL